MYVQVGEIERERERVVVLSQAVYMKLEMGDMIMSWKRRFSFVAAVVVVVAHFISFIYTMEEEALCCCWPPPPTTDHQHHRNRFILQWKASPNATISLPSLTLD